MSSTDAAPRPHPGRALGARRRAELIDAGVQVLAEKGWTGTAARAVAERAGAQLGLIHYHFGGFPRLKRAIAAAVIEGAFAPVLDTIADAEQWQDGLTRAITAGEEAAAGPAGKLSAELMVASLQDEDVRQQLAEALVDARQELAGILVNSGVPAEDATGLATGVVALLDGLLLHRLIDAELPLSATAQVLTSLGRQ